MDIMGIGTAISNAVGTVADKFFVDAKDKEAFKLKALELQQNGEFKSIELQLSAILAEAKSTDPWTSRARPMFLYICYILILASIPMGILSAIYPDTATQIIVGFKQWLAAIPSEIIGLMGVGYLGYTGARSYDKKTLTK